MTKSKIRNKRQIAEQQLTVEGKRYLSDILERRRQPSVLRLSDEQEQHFRVSPLLLGAVGAQTYFHPDGECATALAAKQQEVPFIVSAYSSYSLEEIRDAVPDSELWFQTHIFKDKELTRHFLQRAELAGYQAIVLSVSNDIIYQDADQLEKGGANFVVDPIFLQKHAESARTFQEKIAEEYDTGKLTWHDIQDLTSFTTLPVFIYGDLSIDDIRAALQHHIDGIILTNVTEHNLDFLERIKMVIGESIPIVLEMEVETNQAWNHYLQHGATAISIKENYLYGLAASGAAGVEETIYELFV